MQSARCGGELIKATQAPCLSRAASFFEFSRCRYTLAPVFALLRENTAHRDSCSSRFLVSRQAVPLAILTRYATLLGKLHLRTKTQLSSLRLSYCACILDDISHDLRNVRNFVACVIHLFASLCLILFEWYTFSGIINPRKEAHSFDDYFSTHEASIIIVNLYLKSVRETYVLKSTLTGDRKTKQHSLHLCRVPTKFTFANTFRAIIHSYCVYILRAKRYNFLPHRPSIIQRQ